MEGKRIHWKVSKWFKWEHYEMTKCIIEEYDRSIRPNTKIDNKLLIYSPFDYYNEAYPLAEDIFSSVLKKKNYQHFSSKYIHTLFASLQNTDEVYKWILHFGFPYIPDASEMKRITIDDITDFVEKVNADDLYEAALAQRTEVNASIVLQEASLMRWTIDLHDTLSELNSHKGRNKATIPYVDENIYEALYYYAEFYRFFLVGNIWFDQGVERINKDLSSEADNRGADIVLQDLIQNIFSLMLKNCLIFPAYQKTNRGFKPIWEWKFDSLLSAMYIMLFTDFQGGSIKKCARKDCQIYYATPRFNQKYCSQYCQEREKRARFNNKQDAKDKKRIYNKKYYLKNKNKGLSL